MARSNDEVAAALGELADLLAISGGDPYRVRAYEKAARSVAEYPLEVDELDQKGLDGIPAVGSHIAAKIVQLLGTGHIEELDDLRGQLPAGLRSLLGVPGLGPKRARQVYDELHVASVPELVEALRSQQLRGLRGWGEKSEEHVAESLRQLCRGRGPDAARHGARSRRGPPRGPATGARRARGDLCGVASPDVRDDRRPRPARRLERAHRRRWTSSGRFPTSERSRPAARPRRWRSRRPACTSTSASWLPTSFGAALVYFTGSKAHGIHLRRIAQRRGLKLSEYALERVEDGAVLASATEEQVYAAIGMSFVPPTLREDRGEIEIAERGVLPRLVEATDLRGDLHTHTNLTDGLATLEEMVAAARRRHYRYLAITDHAPLLYMQRMTAEKALAQRSDLRRLADDHLTLLHGSELNVQPDGSLDWDDDFLSGFDLLVASVHSSFRMSRDDMTKRLIRAIDHPAVSIIGHPTSRSLGHRTPIDFDAEAVFSAAARAGTALEINGFPDRLDLSGELSRLAQDRGVVFAISSDAHATRHLDNIVYGVATAQRGWVRPENVINTWPITRLRRFLAKGRAR